jgi:hypothetical protein
LGAATAAEALVGDALSGDVWAEATDELVGAAVPALAGGFERDWPEF